MTVQQAGRDELTVVAEQADPAGDRAAGAHQVRDARRDWPALAAVVGVAVAWGLSFVVVKDALASAAPGTVVGWRFGIAAVVLIALRPGSIMIIDGRVLRHGVVLGALLGAAFLLCTYGMRTVPVITSAFIVGTVVVFTPVVAWLWLGQRIPARTRVAVALAITGLGLLTLRGTSGGPAALLIVAAALVWAIHLCGLGRWVGTGRVYASTVVQLVTAALLAVVVSTVTGDELRLPDATAVSQMIFLGGVATAAAFVAITWSQTRVDATITAILLTLEPVIGAGAAVTLGEPVTVAAVIGSVTVLAASGLVVARSGTAPLITQDGSRGLTRTLPRPRPRSATPPSRAS